DHDVFEKREEASKVLALLGPRAEPALRKALAADPSVEMKRRIEGLLSMLAPTPKGERLRHLRAIEILEHIGTADARRLLEKLSSGVDDDPLTQEAKASVERLARRR